MRKIIAVAIALVLSGCATQPQKVLYKEGVSEDQVMRDNVSCRQYGMQSAQANGLTENMFVEIWIRKQATQCLRDLGYR